MTFSLKLIFHAVISFGVLNSCQANELDRQSFSHSDFGCAYGLCRHTEMNKSPVLTNTPSSVQAFKRARGGQQKKPRIMNKALQKVSTSSDCIPGAENDFFSKDQPCGWGMF
mmetsp:Transcript_23497/g.35707  ORF Transcript_23497/g.35707 Transcript_23497/m.35707 type:complete len:112 (-) Transcript_23497:116-451(-)